MSYWNWHEPLTIHIRPLKQGEVAGDSDSGFFFVLSEYMEFFEGIESYIKNYAQGKEDIVKGLEVEADDSYINNSSYKLPKPLLRVELEPLSDGQVNRDLQDTDDIKK
jgi:hypothetical protein